MTDTLPEGTDHILTGASSASRDPIEGNHVSSAGDRGADAGDAASLRDKVDDLRSAASAKASEVWSKYQVSDKAMEFAESGKTRATGALDEMARMISDTAGRIDEQIGAGYGDYVRKAADAVSGASSNLRDKSIDALLDDAREIVRKSPAIAIGATAAAGFALARILKAGSDALEAAAKDAAATTTKAAQDVASDISDTVRKSAAKSRKSTSGSDSSSDSDA